MSFQSRLELVVDSRSGEQRLRAFEGQLNSTEKAGESVTRVMTGFKAAIAAVSAAAGGFGFARVIRETAQFQDAMLGLQAVSGATQQQMKQLEAQARALGATSMFSAQQAGEAQRFLAMAGLEVNEVLSATPGILKLATAGQMELAQAADIASNVLGGFGLEVEELARVNDVLAATSAGSNTSIEQLGQALSYAAPVARAAKVSIEEAAAAIGVLSDAGLQGSRAGTGLLGVIRQLSNVTSAGAGALEQYGLSVHDVDVSVHGLETVMSRIRDSGLAEDVGASMRLFGSEAGVAAQIVANGSDRVRDFTGELENAEGAADRAALILGSGLTGSMRGFQSAVGESILQLGDSGLASAFESVTDNATALLSVYNGMLPEFADANNLTDEQTSHFQRLADSFAAAAGGAGALTAAYITMTGATRVATAAQVVLNRVINANPFVLAATSVIALSGALYGARNALVTFGDTTARISDWLNATWTVTSNIVQSSLQHAFQQASGYMETFGEATGGVTSYLWNTFQALMGNIAGIAKTTVNGIIAYFMTLRDVFGIVAGAVFDAFKGSFDSTLEIAKGFWQSLKDVFAGDFSFTAFTDAVNENILRDMQNAANLIGEAFRENFSQDYLGDMAEFAGQEISKFKEEVSDTAFRLRFLHNDSGLVAEGFEGLGEETESVAERLARLKRELEENSKLSKEAAREMEQFASVFQSLRAEFDPLGHAQAEFNERVAMMDTLLAAGKIGIDDHAAAVGLLKEQLKEAREEAGGFGSELRTLRNRLQPARAAQIQMAQSMNTLSLAYASGRIALEDYLQLVWRLQEAHIEASQEVEKAASYSFTTWEEVALNTVRRVDNAGQDLWLGFIDGSRNALDTVKRFFQQTLAEIAHMLITQRLTIAVAGSLGMGGSGAAMAGEGGGFGGMGSMLSTGRNVWNAAQQGFGNIAWTGASNTAYAGGWAGSATSGMGQSGLWGGSTANFQGMQGLAGAGAGFAGGWAGNQVFGSSEYGGVLSAIGTAIGTYFGGPIGAAIGSFIGSGLGALFGHEKTSFRGEFVTREREQGWQSLSQQERRDRDWYYGHHATESALGTLGFTHSGSQRVHRAFDMDAGHDAAEWAQELANAAAEMDNFVASLVDSDDDVQAMADAVQSLHIRSGNASKIIQFALVDRPLAAIEAVGLGFGERITDAIRDSASPQEAVEALMAALSLREAFTEIGGAAVSDMMDHIHHVLEEGTDTLAGALEGLGTAYSAMVLIDSGAERLNLQFDALAEGAIHAAWAVQDMAGGLDNLAALQSGYYATYFSEAEQAQHAIEDVSAAFDELGLALPATRDGFRALVEAQDLHTEAGQEAYVALLSLSGAYDQLNRSMTEQIDAAYQSALGREADADGLAYWMRQVTSGAATLEDALWGIANSAESAASASAAWADAGRTVSSSLAGIRETVLLDQLGSDEARYNYFREQAEGLARLIPQLDSAEAITDVTRRISGLTSQAYRILDSDQKSEMGDEFLRYLSRTEELSLQQLDDLSRQNQENADRQAEKNGKAVADAVAKEVGRIADAIIRNLEDSKKSNQDIADAVKRAVSQTGPAARYPEVDNRGREVNA